MNGSARQVREFADGQAAVPPAASSAVMQHNRSVLSPPDPDARPVELLLVDDRAENLQALRAILGDQAGVHLVEASSAEEALRQLLEHDFALVLLDALLPEIDGFEVARLMKQRERTRDVPILFLTAAGSEAELVRRAYDVGAVDYLVKPVSPEIVRAKVAVFVDLARKNGLLREQSALLQEAERRQQAIELAEARVASELHYRQLAESIPQTVWRAQPDSRFEYWNRRWFDYTGACDDISAEQAWQGRHPCGRGQC